ncbi:MAG: hypothetical protein MI810_20740 [Flavobacteriales bacterium]|nr:hypothetical protein [Flavobacteriales bacterium]
MLIRKKFDANQLANVFVNSLLEAIDNGFDDVSELINEDAAFTQNPQIDKQYEDNFLLIVVVGNLRFLNDHFEAADATNIRSLIIQKLSAVYNMNHLEFEKIVSEYDSFLSRVNHPSKNTLYAMSKAVFHKLNLNDYQESYFKNMRTPNPLFLKRMDDLMTNFLWDWEVFFKKYKMNLG